MRVFVTGASGFIGSAVVRELVGAGHRVLGLARSEAAGGAVAAAGAEVQRGSLEDVDGLVRAAKGCDGVIHTAFDHDFVNVPREVAAAADMRAIEALGAALAGSERPLVITSGLGVLASGGIFTEADTSTSPGAHRVQCERAAMELAGRGVRSSVMRLPPTVHGDGDHGFVPMLIGIARERGVSGFVGDGRGRWPAVHRLDAARAFRLALEKGPPASTFHAVAEEGVRTRDIAEAIGRHLRLPVESRPPAHFGFLGAVFGLDVIASSARTQAQLGWQPREPGLIADLDHGRYFG